MRRDEEEAKLREEQAAELARAKKMSEEMQETLRQIESGEIKVVD